MRKIEEVIISDLVTIIDNAIHPSIKFAQLAAIRQALLTSPKVEDANSTHTTVNEETR